VKLVLANGEDFNILTRTQKNIARQLGVSLEEYQKALKDMLTHELWASGQ